MDQTRTYQEIDQKQDKTETKIHIISPATIHFYTMSLYTIWMQHK